ncbi:AAL100Cp [Eremothecium gossypii ATCC 10895]|uniref:AAL100Cp n=1 Tax=Eremothecium gossypii (strain ATCC 10895 / CBS 109.51 / FGSC 9923 / NRRL Y-1056) TaxID=284811 RepID=Q75F28_EREGS|nr:AAL100Cp [Eremothecium gossypii ATCC 10895]AAS50266.1 AAL100Cp [Eremothecium gossypii ATCC 10895]AEY94551.1 FAAL100Cp [Eremothecium gossypii FDAG1]
MPVTKSLSKLQKGMKNKQHTIHPKGRKLQQLNKATIRDEKIQTKKRAHNEKRSNELARVKFIQDAINVEQLKEQLTFTHEQCLLLIREFIGRDDDELEELKKKRRANRPPTSRHQLLEAKKRLELEELRTGFLCPDLTDADNVAFLRRWNGTFGALATLKLVRINERAERVVGGTKPVAQPAAAADVHME